MNDDGECLPVPIPAPVYIPVGEETSTTPSPFPNERIPWRVGDQGPIAISICNCL